MVAYTCERCHEDNPHGLALGMCSPCLDELASLKRGDPVEWLHPGGRWIKATFLQLMPREGTAMVRSPLYAILYKKQSRIRRVEK
jgi:hypothetical protein